MLRSKIEVFIISSSSWLSGSDATVNWSMVILVIAMGKLTARKATDKFWENRLVPVVVFFSVLRDGWVEKNSTWSAFYGILNK